LDFWGFQCTILLIELEILKCREFTKLDTH